MPFYDISDRPSPAIRFTLHNFCPSTAYFHRPLLHFYHLYLSTTRPLLSFLFFHHISFLTTFTPPPYYHNFTLLLYVFLFHLSFFCLSLKLSFNMFNIPSLVYFNFPFSHSHRSPFRPIILHCRSLSN